MMFRAGKLYRYIVLPFLICLFQVGTAQEVLEDVRTNPQLKDAEQIKQASFRAKVVDTLPFIDDFSYAGPYPDPERWIDNKVFINYNYPIDPPSIGVATFDALNAQGQPYVVNSSSTGSADTLTSQPLKMGGLSAADSVFFSFYFQAGGRGNLPEAHDSLILQFKAEIAPGTHEWITVFNAKFPGVPTNRFQRVMININEPKYFYDGFQFRFRNYATLSGNNDHWHIDYVKLDKGRFVSDTLLNDVVVNQPSPDLLSRYYSMPLNQFRGFEQQELNNNIIINAYNHYNVLKNTTFRYVAIESCTNTTLAANDFETINFPPLTDTFAVEPMFSNEITNFFNTIPCDTVTITTKFYFTQIATDPRTTTNDTFTLHQYFGDYFAYDDGTAEQVYGVVGNNAQVAYEFNANVADTITGISIHFAHVDKDISGITFSLRIWDSLDMASGEDDLLLHQQHFQQPQYVDAINGFHFYRLDTPRVVSGKFYIGWYQESNESMRIGFDKNNNAKSNLFFNVFNSWQQSNIDGALMMRPVFSEAYPVGIKDVLSGNKELRIYPNPVKDILNIGLSPEGQEQLVIYNALGVEVENKILDSKHLNVNHLSAGIYFIKIIDKRSGSIYTAKFIKAE